MAHPAAWLLDDAARELLAGDPTGGPLAATAALAAVAALGCWLAAMTTGYWSWVDRLWSLLPPAYALVFAAWPAGGEPPNARLLLVCILIALWGARLTWNFARKGGYGSEEDYRWPALRAWFAAHDPAHPLLREVFSLTFVAAYQHALIWGFVAPPLYVVWRARSTPLSALDWVCTLAFAAALACEAWADEVQFAFQTRKHAMTPKQRAAAGGDIARGFLSATAPFTFSRHLNFFGEQAMWWCVVGFAVAAGAPPVHWAAAGAALLSGLFQGSTWMTELLSTNKYPAYAAYARTTSRLVPWFPGPPLDSAEGRALVAAALAASRGADAKAH